MSDDSAMLVATAFPPISHFFSFSFMNVIMPLPFLPPFRICRAAVMSEASRTEALLQAACDIGYTARKAAYDRSVREKATRDKQIDDEDKAPDAIERPEAEVEEEKRQKDTATVGLCDHIVCTKHPSFPCLRNAFCLVFRGHGYFTASVSF